MTDTKQDLARQPRGELTLAMLTDITGYQPAEIALIARTVAIGAPMQELAVFLHACRTLQLDPLLRQAYWIRRGNPPRGTLQVGIDGFRGLADRHGNYAGSSEPVFRGQQQCGKITVPTYCQVTTWKIVAGHKAAFTGEARWDEFYPGDGAVGSMWRKMPFHMLSKCAEAQSLRKGWPALLGHLGMDPDMDVASISVEELPTVAAPAPQDSPPAASRRPVPAQEYDRIFYGAGEPDGPPVQPQADAESDSPR